MSKNLPILAIVGGVMALLGALVLVDLAVLVLAVFALVAAGFLFARKDREGITTGAVAVVLTILGFIGRLENISRPEGGGVDFGIPAGLGLAFLVIACLVPAAAILWLHWHDLEMKWAAPLAAVLALSALFALIWHGRLTDQSDYPGFLVGLLGLAGSVVPAVLRLRE